MSLDLLARIERNLLAIRLNARVEEAQVALLFGHVGGHLAELGRDETHERARQYHHAEAHRGRQRVVEVARLRHRDERVCDEHDVEQWLRHLGVQVDEQLNELVYVFRHVLIHLGRFGLLDGDFVVDSILKVVFVSSRIILTFFISLY